MTLVGCTAQRQCPAFAASVYNGGDPCPREENQISLNSIFPHLLWDPYYAKTGCYLPQKICSLPTRNKTQHEVTSSMGWSSVSREAQNKIFTFRGGSFAPRANGPTLFPPLLFGRWRVVQLPLTHIKAVGLPEEEEEEGGYKC